MIPFIARDFFKESSLVRLLREERLLLPDDEAFFLPADVLDFLFGVCFFAAI